MKLFHYPETDSLYIEHAAHNLDLATLETKGLPITRT